MDDPFIVGDPVIIVGSMPKLGRIVEIAPHLPSSEHPQVSTITVKLAGCSNKKIPYRSDVNVLRICKCATRIPGSILCIR